MAAADFSFLARLVRIQVLRLEVDLLGFPNAVCQLDSLRELQLRRLRSVDEVPSELQQLTELTHLTLADCGLTRVPDVLCAMTSLEEVSLALNELTLEWQEDEGDGAEAFPLALTRLKSLRVLTLTCCDLETVPDVVGRLPALEELYLSGNRVWARAHAFIMLPSTCSALTVRLPDCAALVSLAYSWPMRDACPECLATRKLPTAVLVPGSLLAFRSCGTGSAHEAAHTCTSP